MFWLCIIACFGIVMWYIASAALKLCQGTVAQRVGRVTKDGLFAWPELSLLVHTHAHTLSQIVPTDGASCLDNTFLSSLYYVLFYNHARICLGLDFI